MNESIIHFINDQTCATICCVDAEGHPWCFSCYYAANAAEGLLYFKSSAGAHHVELLHTNPLVAGTILPDKLSKLVVKGIQFEGKILSSADPLTAHALERYLRKHPMALAVAGDIWTVRLDHVKFTDSTLGFGKKVIWKRETE